MDLHQRHQIRAVCESPSLRG